MLGLSSIFLFNFFLHVFCNSTKTSANSSVLENSILYFLPFSVDRLAATQGL